MPAPDRLAELQRQRALLQEHLAWLEREIVAEMRTATPAAAPFPTIAAQAPPSIDPANFSATVSPPVAAASPTSPSAKVRSSEAVIPPPARVAVPPLEIYRQDAASLKSDLRKGCLLYFALALALLVLGAGAFYFLYSRHLPRAEKTPAPAVETTR